MLVVILAKAGARGILGPGSASRHYVPRRVRDTKYRVSCPGCCAARSGALLSRGLRLHFNGYTAIFRCRTGAPTVRLSAASMMALASMP
ncbi:hypothetical protein V1279_001606 [Bradyrhizobium sp. AZCC 1610]